MCSRTPTNSVLNLFVTPATSPIYSIVSVPFFVVNFTNTVSPLRALPVLSFGINISFVICLLSEIKNAFPDLVNSIVPEECFNTFVIFFFILYSFIRVFS